MDPVAKALALLESYLTVEQRATWRVHYIEVKGAETGHRYRIWSTEPRPNRMPWNVWDYTQGQGLNTCFVAQEIHHTCLCPHCVALHRRFPQPPPPWPDLVLAQVLLLQTVAGEKAIQQMACRQFIKDLYDPATFTPRGWAAGFHSPYDLRGDANAYDGDSQPDRPHVTDLGA